MADLPRPIWIHRFEIAPGKWVFVPDEATKAYGRELKERIANRWTPPTFFIHLGDKGHVRALQKHLHHRWFARIDIRGFYSSIRKTRITRHLTKLFRNYEQARVDAALSTVRDPTLAPTDNPRYVLPFGFVQSPILAALCLDRSKVGNALRQLPAGVKCCVYVDDIFLSVAHCSTLLTQAYEQVCEAVVASGFELSEEKLAPPSKQGTAFNLDIRTGSMRIADARLEAFRTAIRNTGNDRVVSGILGYVRSVNASQATELESDLV